MKLWHSRHVSWALGGCVCSGVAMPRMMSDMERNRLIPHSHWDLDCLGAGVDYSNLIYRQ